MNRIAILSVGDYRHITLISKYVSYFKRNNIPYDVICTDRYLDGIKREGVFQYPFPNACNKLSKIKSFITFRRWATSLINKGSYDFIVVWNENTALLFADYLLHKFKGKYCINIRDVDFLNQSFLNIIRAKVIRKSCFSTYCSTAKLDFPKGYDYLLMRSINLEILSNVAKRNALVKQGVPIRIVFLGKIRFPYADYEIIQAFGNDDRYELYFIGAGSESLRKYTEIYSNLKIIGSYEPEETAGYLGNADVINSYFGTRVLGYERMSSIRFSYAPYMHIPVIVGKETNMCDEGNKYGFAYGFGECKLEEEADHFYQWYYNIKISDFIDGCEKYCRDVFDSDKVFYDKLDKVFLNGSN